MYVCIYIYTYIPLCIYVYRCMYLHLYICMIDVYIPFFFFFFCFFQGCTCSICKFPGEGSNQSCSHSHGNARSEQWAASVTYATAHSNAESLTHWDWTRIPMDTSWLCFPWATMGLHVMPKHTFRILGGLSKALKQEALCLWQKRCQRPLQGPKSFSVNGQGSSHTASEPSLRVG